MPEHPLFWHYPHYGNQGGTPGSALRCGKWKYIEFYEDHSVRLQFPEFFHRILIGCHEAIQRSPSHLIDSDLEIDFPVFFCLKRFL